MLCTRSTVCLIACSVFLLWPLASPAQRADGAPGGDIAWLAPYRPATAKIIAEATYSQGAWNRLAELSDSFPARLSGSASLQRAIDWVADRMKKDGLDQVRLKKVMVPHWVRGAEHAEVLEPFPGAIAMAALGGSVGTPSQGIAAEAVVVKSYDELKALGAARVKGKIVVYNVVYRTDLDPLVSYRQGTAYRGAGASRAAKLGAVGAFVRSVGPTAHRTPHTGGMRYAPDAPQVPVAAISGEDADKLQRMQDRGQQIVLRMTLGAETLPDVKSANIVTELRGREKPEEIVLIGGHLDQWDLAAGAMDDGGGVVATWEALRVLKKLNLVPRRTIRMVAFVNEENGGRGGSGLPRQIRRSARQARAGARVGQRHPAADGLGLQRHRQGARGRPADCVAAAPARRRRDHGALRRRGHHPRCAPATSRGSRRKSTCTATS